MEKIAKKSLLRAVFGSVMNAVRPRWVLDHEKTAQHANLYYINCITGDRMAVHGSFGYQPVDMAWLAEAENEAIVKGFGQTRTYTQQELKKYRDMPQNILPPRTRGAISCVHS